MPGGFATIGLIDKRHSPYSKEAAMPTELSACVTLQDGLRFAGTDRSGSTVYLDATAAEGGGTAPTPMELLLISLAGCSAMDVIAILRKKRQPVEHLEVRAHGQRRDEHPTVFTTIDLEYIVHGSGIDPVAVRRAIDLSRDRYCPIWAMLKTSVPIRSSYRILRDEPILVPAD
jgi:putative redox protein